MAALGGEQRQHQFFLRQRCEVEVLIYFLCVGLVGRLHGAGGGVCAALG